MEKTNNRNIATLEKKIELQSKRITALEGVIQVLKTK